MDTMQAIITRQSIRSFTNQPVDEEQIEAIVRAGMHAPSAHHKRTWRMISVTERKTLDALSELGKYWKMLKEATLCIATCVYAPGIKAEDMELQIHNGAAATQNMLLAAHALGLGAVWLGISPERPAYLPTKELLSIPEEARVVSLIAVGHPQEPIPPRREPLDRLEPEKWFKERWQ
ncbi:nitroreductase family protein [Eubacteriales bacterium OttesenSCG-928-K08]|nr:nitroreductase family protein [Eubacteriales bacterium OttesenSCG-928-K08]